MTKPQRCVRRPRSISGAAVRTRQSDSIAAHWLCSSRVSDPSILTWPGQ